MVTVPAATPVVTPVVLPIVAIAILLLLQVPPTSLKVVVKPIQTFVIPVIADGNGLTVKGVLMIQPVLSV